MTVAELINELSKLDHNLKVFKWDQDGDEQEIDEIRVRENIPYMDYSKSVDKRYSQITGVMIL